MLHALLPLKDLSNAKTRLSGVLSLSRRRALAQAMAEDVLQCLLHHPKITTVTLLSPDPTAPHLAASSGARYLDERSLGSSGLNGVLTEALSQQGDAALHHLIAHGDLPARNAGDISLAVEALQSTDVVIGSDLAGQGTNLLAFRGGRQPQLAFGTDSYTRHRAAAEQAGLMCKNLQTSGIGFDVDAPADLATLLALYRKGALGNHTSRLLQAGLAERLSLVIDSLQTQPCDDGAAEHSEG